MATDVVDSTGAPDALTGAAAVAAIAQLRGAAQNFDARGWSPATSSNYSVRIAADRVLITRSGADKGNLQADDFLLMNLAGSVLTFGKPSAETALHLAIYRQEPTVGSVLHTHAPNGVVLSRWLRKKHVTFAGWELQKAFSGETTHKSRVRVPIFDNDQDMERAAATATAHLDIARDVPCYGFLLRGHGLYAWGADVTVARRHIEAFEYLFGCELAMARLRG